MERFFIVTEESYFYKYCLQYKKYSEDIKQAADQFAKDQGFETTSYGADADNFAIEPTEKDRENFGNVLVKFPYENGLFDFKKNSKVNRAWATLTASKGINKYMFRPSLRDEWGNLLSRRTSSRHFVVNEIMYASLSADCDFSETPKGFIEIKASKFYKIIEDWEAEQEQKKIAEQSKKSLEESAKMKHFEDFQGKLHSNLDETKLLTKEEFMQEAIEIYKSNDKDAGIPLWSYSEDNEKICVSSVILNAVSEYANKQKTSI